MKKTASEQAKKHLEAAREKLQAPKKSIFKRIAILLTHRLMLTVVLILLQIICLALMILRWSSYFIPFYFVCVTVSLLSVLHILNKHGHPDYKIAWLVPIMAFPVFGGLFYLLYGGNWATARDMKRLRRMETLSNTALGQSETLIEALVENNLEAANQSRYILRVSSCPPYVNTKTEYLPIGEVYYQRMLEELEKAQHYIFLQYFIIKEGEMWDTILSILTKKAAEGVDVRVMYDDVGCIFTLPKNYAQKLEEKGIACAVFNPFRPVVSLRLNNRDHRKICVIDGHTGFTGGLNLSDEYINQWERFGHWKDTGIMLQGEAVWSLTAMFLSCWDYTKGIEEELDNYRPNRHQSVEFVTDGVVQPYTSNPGVDSVGAGIYLNLINRAKRYLYITTPYLVIDDAMSGALCTAARSGVDVRIITPHIPDKRYVFELTRAHYVPLMEAGVKIYEYTPGFIHAKTFAVDDEYGVVGTVNMDYRSLFLHYECGVWLYRSSTVLDIRNDFLKTQAQSQEVALEDATHLDWAKRLYRSVLRVLAPLM
jgi:cardiolipin synthase